MIAVVSTGSLQWLVVGTTDLKNWQRKSTCFARTCLGKTNHISICIKDSTMSLLHEPGGNVADLSVAILVRCYLGASEEQLEIVCYWVSSSLNLLLPLQVAGRLRAPQRLKLPCHAPPASRKQPPCKCYMAALQRKPFLLSRLSHLAPTPMTQVAFDRIRPKQSGSTQQTL